MVRAAEEAEGSSFRTYLRAEHSRQKVPRLRLAYLLSLTHRPETGPTLGHSGANPKGLDSWVMTEKGQVYHIGAHSSHLATRGFVDDILSGDVTLNES